MRSIRSTMRAMTQAIIDSAYATEDDATIEDVVNDVHTLIASDYDHDEVKTFLERYVILLDDERYNDFANMKPARRQRVLRNQLAYMRRLANDARPENVAYALRQIDRLSAL